RLAGVGGGGGQSGVRGDVGGREIGGVAGCVFFFQAEDGIRALIVTGVQTCALPILPQSRLLVTVATALWPRLRQSLQCEPIALEIGRASCRERVEIWVGGGSVKKK